MLWSLYIKLDNVQVHVSQEQHYRSIHDVQIPQDVGYILEEQISMSCILLSIQT